MLFMSIFTFEPEKRDEVIKRRVEKGPLTTPGAKILGEWSDISGHRVFRLGEVEDSRAMVAAAMAWADLGKIEITPVMPTDEIMKLLSSKK
jgi:hypothetical protein